MLKVVVISMALRFAKMPQQCLTYFLQMIASFSSKPNKMKLFKSKESKTIMLKLLAIVLTSKNQKSLSAKIATSFTGNYHFYSWGGRRKGWRQIFGISFPHWKKEKTMFSFIKDRV